MKTLNQPTTENKANFYLVTGNVVYKVPSDDPEVNPIGSITLNGVITTPSVLLKTSDLREAQAVLQQHFGTKMKGSNAEIIDVIILNLMYMGYQTPTEFNDLNLVRPE